MKLKRLLALTCSLALLASPITYAMEREMPVSVTAVYTSDMVTGKVLPPAEDYTPAISEEEALKIVISTFEVPESYGKPVGNFWHDQASGNATWNFYWNPEVHPELSAKFYLSVGVNANDGSIISYSWSDQFGTEPKEAKFDRASALPKAEEWLKKLVSAERLTSLKLDENEAIPSDQLYYNWIRMVNEIPYYNNSVSISIDPVTGNLLSFYFNWEDIEFPAKSDLISVEQAQDAWKTQVGVELVYQDIYNRFTGSEPRLVYRPKQEGLMIDALTGQVIDWNGTEWTGPYKPVTLPEATSSWVAPAKPLTQEEALTLVRQAMGGITLNAPTSMYSYERNAGKFASEDNVLIWNFSWNNDEKQMYYNVGVDATHGVIVEFYSGQEWKSDEYFKDKTPIEEAEARKAAIEALVKIRPDLVGQVQLLDAPVTEKYMPEEYIQRQYYFSFVRLVDGVRYPNNHVSVTIDRYSGEIVNLYSYWNYNQIPGAEETITPDQALAVLGEESPFELVYATIYPQPMVKEPVKPSVRLIYRAKPAYGGSTMLDARNGHLLDYDGRDLTEMRKGITDIAGLDAEEAIKLAVSRGIFQTVDGKFNPQGTMTKGELAKALVTAFDRVVMYEMMMDTAKSSIPAAPSYSDVDLDSPYAPYIYAAIQMGIFKPADPNSKFDSEAVASREEVALYTVRAMGFTFIDGFAATIGSGYTDEELISEAHRNAVGLLVGLKVLDKGGEFQPQAAITRADLAKILIAAGKVQYPSYPYYR